MYEKVNETEFISDNDITSVRTGNTNVLDLKYTCQYPCDCHNCLWIVTSIHYRCVKFYSIHYSVVYDLIYVTVYVSLRRLRNVFFFYYR